MKTRVLGLLAMCLFVQVTSAACDDATDDTSPADTTSTDTTSTADTGDDRDTTEPDDTGDDTTDTLVADTSTDSGDDLATDTSTDDTLDDTADTADTLDDADAIAQDTMLDCISGVPPEGQTVEMMTLESADGAVEVGYARRVSGIGTGETWTFDLMRFGVARDGQLECITEPDQLEHLEGHHNWNETLTATADDGTVYTLRMMVDFTDGFDWTDWLESTGPRAFPAQVDLEATDCTTAPQPDPNFCFQRSDTNP